MTDNERPKRLVLTAQSIAYLPRHIKLRHDPSQSRRQHKPAINTPFFLRAGTVMIEDSVDPFPSQTPVKRRTGCCRLLQRVQPGGGIQFFAT